MQIDERTAGALRAGVLGVGLDCGGKSIVRPNRLVGSYPVPFVAALGRYIVMMSPLYQLAEQRHKTNALIAVVFPAISATPIFFTYIS